MRSRKLALLFVPVLLLPPCPARRDRRAVRHAQAESRAEVLKYWTPAKMKSAKWLDVHYDAEKVGHLVTRSQGAAATAAAITAVVAGQRKRRSRGHRARVLRVWRRRLHLLRLRGDGLARASRSSSLPRIASSTRERRAEFATNWMFIPAFDLRRPTPAPTRSTAAGTPTAITPGPSSRRPVTFNDQAVQ